MKTLSRNLWTGVGSYNQPTRDLIVSAAEYDDR